MKRPIRFLKGTIVLAIVVVTALYVERVHVTDLLSEANAPALPEAVAYGDVKKGTDGTAGTKAEEVPVIKKEDSSASSDPIVPSVPISSVPTPPPSAPASINLAVPFTSQAPLGTWDEVHEETCEEAAIYMVAEFYKGTSGDIDPQVADAELLRLVDLENKMFGYYKDTNAAETVKLEAAEFGYAATIAENPTADDIRHALADGHPVIVPTAGRLLGNPYFSGAGPLYHMVVLRGYVGDSFISNDPGTRHGEAYVYPVTTIMDAMHDWNGGDVLNGAKVVILITP